MRVCAFITDEKIYRDSANRLMESLIPWGLDKTAFLHIIQPFGSWEEHTHFKAEFSLMIQQRFPGEKLLLLDADAEIVGNPRGLENIDCDLGAHYITQVSDTANYKKGERVLASGTLLIGNTPQSMHLSKLWMTYIEKMPEYGCGDQDKLKLAVQKMREVDRGFRFHQLGSEYLVIFKWQKLKLKERGIKPVIFHHQISHEYKRQKNEL